MDPLHPPRATFRVRAPRLKFVWGTKDAIQGRWFLGLFGLYDRTEGGRSTGVAISGRGLLIWGAICGVVLYVAAATTLYYLWSRSPYNLLTYTDALLYPVRRNGIIMEKKGQAFITQGSDLWRGQKWHAAAVHLRLGLERYPRDIKARALLAQYYVLMNRRPLAAKLLNDGLTADYPGRAYLQTLFDVAEQGEDYALVVQLCERYRATLTSEAMLRDRRWLQTKQFSALIAMGRAEDALALASEEAGWNDLAGEQRVMALLELKRNDEALRVLSEWKARPGSDQRLVVRLQVRAFREAKKMAEMEAALTELRQLSPSQAAPVVYGVVQRSLAGQAEAARASLEAYLSRLARTTQDIQLVAEPLAEIGDITLLERCAAAAAERGYPGQPFQVLLVQTYLLKGDWAAAGRVLGQMKPPPATGRDAAAAKAWHTWIHALLDAATIPTDTAQAALLEFLRSRPWPMRIYKRTLETLRRADKLDTERDALGLGLASFPASTWLQTRRDEVARLIAARPTPVIAAAPVEKINWSEKDFFDRLDELVAAARWDEAEQHMQAVRSLQPAPAWVPRRDDRFRLAQVRIGHGRGRSTEMLAAARVYLTGDTERSRTMLDLAREIDAKGDKTAALALAREVQRKSPDYPPVIRLLAEWAPKGGRK